MSAKSIMQRATEIYLILFASVHLLFMGTSGYSRIFEAKTITFCVITLLYFLCACICAHIYTYDEKKSIKAYLKKHISAVHVCVILYMMFTVISGLLSQHFPETVFGVSRFEGIFTICCYGLSFLLVSFFPCAKRYLLIIFSASVVLFSAVCIIQLAGLNPLSLYPEGMNFYDAGVRYTTAFIGTIGNANLSGAFICLALPFLIILLIKAKSKLRFLLTIPVVLLTYVAANMDVDSTVLSLIFTAFFMIPFILGFYKRGIFIYFGLLILLTVVFIFIIYNFAPESGMLHELSEILHGNISETFGSGRIRIWKNVLSEIPESPIIGKGPDTMRLEDFEPFSRFYPALGKVKTSNIDVAHNEMLNILYHQGILGLISYIGFIFFVFKAWLKNRCDALSLAFGSAFICYLAQSMFTFSMCLVAPYFWICAGMIVGMCNQE